MNGNELMALTKELVKSKWWAWESGMVTIDGEMVLQIMMDGNLHLFDMKPDYYNQPPRIFFDSTKTCLPDIGDECTGGLVLNILSKLCHTESKTFIAMSDASGELDREGIDWEVCTLRGRFEGKSLGEAAAKAIIALGDTK